MKPATSLLVPLWIIAACALWVAWQLTFKSGPVRHGENRASQTGGAISFDPIDVNIVSTQKPLEVAVRSFEVDDPIGVSLQSVNPTTGLNVNIVGSNQPLEVDVDDTTPIQVQVNAN